MSTTEVTLETAWNRLATEPDAVLIDVRTTAEWSFVGVPDLSSLDKAVRSSNDPLRPERQTMTSWLPHPKGSRLISHC